MKYIEVDEELYRHIASKTERIGESASDILRRLLGLSVNAVEQAEPKAISQPSLEVEPLAPHVEVKEITPSVMDFTTLVDEHRLSLQKGAVGRFLFLLESLYQQSQVSFSQILQIQGRDRLYFARSREELLQASPSANPKEIGSSGFWVTTNNNTAKKRAILSEVLVQFGCDAQVASTIAERV
ncbi:replication initiation negative regulator SeqA [Shewanella sp. CG12_big_fil_rev_8_21_14_0_65_47_15]|uniref:replication initiation negative regulator SeqA n=1 Tax=Shewanella sp. CG12_big_fil_rev_8_21_14_0_65_47_15 TaxID=1975537 RepID=UPI000CB7E0D0|nr:replication initiation negative regulator SeqA [Shewanella sp. CG12_big_fil_rev_8_21_14_0_65_47_15]PIW60624.1 MAG: replication initiation negative regulator SeqA [Shewanella sp. CG12_big_fil_rev_8_21_14_0_65_47_15]